MVRAVFICVEPSSMHVELSSLRSGSGSLLPQPTQSQNGIRTTTVRVEARSRIQK